MGPAPTGPISSSANIKAHFNSGSANLRITPSSSPYGRQSPARSPVKLPRSISDPALSLRKVIGTTTSDVNGFDCFVAASHCLFAYIAGATVVVCSVDEQLRISTRFFRARPTAIALNGQSYFSQLAIPPRASSDLRIRPRESGFNSPIASSSNVDWSDSPSKIKERVRAASTVSFGPDGTLLAVGERGYNPRVLIFALGPDSPTHQPLTILTEHAHGVRCLAFSPDGRFLASLGDITDGYLHVWSIYQRAGAARIYLSSKCTSNVSHMIWLGPNLVTVGTRHVKVWRPDEGSNRQQNQETSKDQSNQSPGPRVLPGRNVLLGNALMNSRFSCAVRVKDKALVCTEDGVVCVLAVSDVMVRFWKAYKVPFPVRCIAITTDQQSVLVGGPDGCLRVIELREILPSKASGTSSLRTSDCGPDSLGERIDSSALVALAPLRDHLVTVSTDLKLYRLDQESDEPFSGQVARHMPCHESAVLGVRLLQQPNTFSNADFLTWSASGSVMFWSANGGDRLDQLAIPLPEAPAEVEDDPENELRTLQVVREDFLVHGDRLGSLGVIDCKSRKTKFSIKAHSGPITSIDTAPGRENVDCLIASGGKDRSVQLFGRGAANGTWTLLQTLLDHQGVLSAVLFLDSGRRLVSGAADRLIIVRELGFRATGESGGVDEAPELQCIAFVTSRTITLKACPISMSVLAGCDPDLVLVSTTDRNILKLDLSTGQTVHSFRALDFEGASLTVDALSNAVPQWIAGMSNSNSNKSIVLFDSASGRLVDQEYGHTTGGVTDIALLVRPDQTSIVSAGADGTIMIWDLTLGFRPSDNPRDTEPTPATSEENLVRNEMPVPIATQTPIRKILSKAELAQFSGLTTNTTPKAQPETGTPTPSGRQSPPRIVRKVKSTQSLGRSSGLKLGAIPDLRPPSSNSNLTKPKTNSRRSSTKLPVMGSQSRNRSPSPPPPIKLDNSPPARYVPKAKAKSRPSLNLAPKSSRASILPEVNARPKSAGESGDKPVAEGRVNSAWEDETSAEQLTGLDAAAVCLTQSIRRFREQLHSTPPALDSGAALEALTKELEDLRYAINEAKTRRSSSRANALHNVRRSGRAIDIRPLDRTRRSFDVGQREPGRRAPLSLRRAATRTSSDQNDSSRPSSARSTSSEDVDEGASQHRSILSRAISATTASDPSTLLPLEDQAMKQLLEMFGEKLLGLVDEKIAGSLERQGQAQGLLPTSRERNEPRVLETIGEG